MRNIIQSRSWLLAAAVLLATLIARPSLATSTYEMNFSFSEAILAAHGTPEEDLIAHYEGWDSATARMGKRNMPFIELRNTSSSNTDLTRFTMSIGKPVYNFSDNVLGSYAKLGTTTDVDFTSTAPGGDLLIVDFTDGLAPGEVVRFQVDIDVDAGITGLFPHPDYRMVFFDVVGQKDTTDNSAINVTFQNNVTGANITSPQVIIPDFDQPTDINGVPLPLYLNGSSLRSYDVMDGVEMFELTGMVPEPSAGFLAMGLLGVLGARRNRRR